MRSPEDALCPSCATEMSQYADVCGRCGRELTSLRGQNKYYLVRDRDKFGLALHGRMVLRNMDLKEAQSTLAILKGESEGQSPR
jgi:predicted amidophosphoribosyltransferase